MKTAEYWKGRFEEVEKLCHKEGIIAYQEIEGQYRQAQKELEKQISVWYQRFAKNNNISMAEARRLLSTKELAELKWDVNEYIKYGEQNALDGKWMKQLENASARAHISRLEALKLQMQQQVEVAFGNQLDSLDSAMRAVYSAGYLHTAYEIQKGVGVAWSFAGLNQNLIDQVLKRPWAPDGKNFSDRIWANKQKLLRELDTTLTQGVILGRDPGKMINEMSKRLNVSKTAAGRLVMTESAAFASRAQEDCFKELDVEEYEIVATLDSHTSEICQDMDGQVFKMSDREIGVNAPPFHVDCRTTTIPYFDDEWSHRGERAARGEDGKTYYVPADMTYKEWEKSLLDVPDSVKIPEIKIHRSVGAKGKNYDILDPSTGDFFHFSEGTRIQNVEVFAGSGVRVPLHEGVAEGLSKEFGGLPEKWQHVKGFGVINYFGEDIKAEVHWFQEETVGKVKFKIKRWME